MKRVNAFECQFSIMLWRDTTIVVCADTIEEAINKFYEWAKSDDPEDVRIRGNKKVTLQGLHQTIYGAIQ